MNSTDKMIVAVVAIGLAFIYGICRLDQENKEAEFKFKYEAALNGAPVSVCVK